MRYKLEKNHRSIIVAEKRNSNLRITDILGTRAVIKIII